MNPLPFFPPPARTFSQAGRDDRPPHHGGSHRSSSGINFASLKLTASHTGGGANNGAQSSRSGPNSGSNSPSRTSRKWSTSSRPQTAPRSQQPPDAAPESMSASFSPPASSAAMTATKSSSSSSSGSSGGASGSAVPSGTGDAAPSAPSPAMTPSSPHLPSPRAASGSTLRDKPRSSSSAGSSRRPSRSSTMPSGTHASSSLAVPSGRTGMNLPKGIFFDYIRPEEVAVCHALETRAYDPEDQASRDRMMYRQKNAPHLFLGAFVPAAPPKVAGPLSVGHYSTPRKIIAYINGTASSNLSAHSLQVHSVSNADEGIEAWLVCLHSIVVVDAHRRKGVGLRLLEEFMTRLRRIEDGKGDPRKGPLEQPKGYESVALLCHQESLRFFRKAGFQLQGISHVRCGSGGWIEMRRSIKGRHAADGDAEGGGVGGVGLVGEEIPSKPDTPTAITTASMPISNPTDADWAFSASPTGVVETNSTHGDGHGHGAPLAAFPTGTARHEVSGDGDERGGDDQDETAATPKDDAVAIAGAGVSSSSAADDAPSGPAGAALGGFSQASIMAALAAASKGYAPGTNPSLPFSSVLGQTLAGKTFVEDAFVALEARLVDRRKGREDEDGEGEGTNLAEIWCPREECGCKIIRKGVAMWELAESGPLSDPRLSVESMPSHSAPLPPTPQPPPAPASHIRALKEREREHLKNKKDGETYSTRSTLPGAPPSHETSTPIRPFWSLLNPMSFDNVAFSRDVKWTPPAPQQREGSGSSYDDAANAPGSGSRTPPDADTGNGNGNGGRGDANGSNAPTTKVRKPVRRPTFFSKKERVASGGGSESPSSASSSSTATATTPGGITISHPHRLPESAFSPTGSSPLLSSSSPGSPALGGRDPLTIKYILCGQCETGPLGYVIVPPKLANGKLGEQVGSQISGGGGGAGGTGDLQIYLLAAERVRYRFTK